MDNNEWQFILATGLDKEETTLEYVNADYMYKFRYLDIYWRD